MKMNAISIIEKKKLNKELTQEEINYMISNYTDGIIPDYQMSAFLMTIRLNGMTDEETYFLTKAMVESGDVIDLSDIEGFKVDKHSTGGVGDKVTLIVTPILASLGIPVAKFSGKGLGITGGTVDKLNSIKGFNTELTIEEFINNVKNHGIAVAGQTGNLVPADKKMYALRDVTGTVDSIPLIASSIMSKKIASGADGIVLDVKYGNGAFMKTKEDAQLLGDKMVAIGELYGRKVKYHLSDMSNPLGYFVGNKLEVVEAYKLLQNVEDFMSEDLVNTCIEVATEMYQMSTGESYEASLDKVKRTLFIGDGAKKFEEFIIAQFGDMNDVVIYDTKTTMGSGSLKSGRIESIDAQIVGEVALELGAGRYTKDDKLDYDAGIHLIRKQGDTIEKYDVIFELFTNKPKEEVEHLVDKMLSAYTIK